MPLSWVSVEHEGQSLGVNVSLNHARYKQAALPFLHLALGVQPGDPITSRWQVSPNRLESSVMPNKFNKPKQKTKNPLIWTKWFKCVCFEGNWNSLQGETYKSMFLENISWSFIHCCKHSQFPCRRKLSPYLAALTSVCNGWLCGEDLLVVFVIKVFIPSVDCLHERLEYRATDKNHLSASKRRCLSAWSEGFGKPWWLAGAITSLGGSVRKSAGSSSCGLGSCLKKGQLFLLYLHHCISFKSTQVKVPVSKLDPLWQVLPAFRWQDNARFTPGSSFRQAFLEASPAWPHLGAMSSHGHWVSLCHWAGPQRAFIWLLKNPAS